MSRVVEVLALALSLGYRWLEKLDADRAQDFRDSLRDDPLGVLMQRLSEARGKHPVFAEGKYHALGVIGEEYRELVHAVEHETPERICDEALDVAVTALRLWLGEHKVGAHE